MKLNGFSLATVLLLTGTTHAFAQKASSDNKPMVELTANVKTYYLDRMGYAPNETIDKAFETIFRNCNILSSSGFTLMIDGEEYDYASFTATTTVGQVERIEFITDNGNSSNVGTSGCFNVVLKKVEEGTHGRATFSMDTRTNHNPMFNLTSKKGNWTMWANAGANIFKTKHAEACAIGEGKLNQHLGTIIMNGSGSGSRQKTRALMANLQLQYKGESDVVTFRISDYWKPIKTENFNPNYTQKEEYGRIDNALPLSDTNAERKDYYRGSTSENSCKKIINNYLHAEIDWKHILSDKVTLNAILSETLRNNPHWTETTLIENRYSTEDELPRVVTPENMYPKYSTRYEDIHNHSYNTTLNVYANMKATDGLNLKAGIYGDWDKYTYKEINWFDDFIKTDINYYTLKPYILANYEVGKWAFNIGERLRYSRNTNNIKHSDNTLFAKRNEDGTYEEYYVTFPEDKVDCNKLIPETNASITFTPDENNQIMVAYKHNNYHYKHLQTNGYTDSFLARHYLNEYSDRYNVIDLGYTFTGKNVSARLNATYKKNRYTSSIISKEIDETDGNVSETPSQNSEQNQDTYGVSASIIGTLGIFSINGDIAYNWVTQEYKSFTDNQTNTSKPRYLDISLNPMVNLPLGFKASATATYTHIKTPRQLLLIEDNDFWWGTLRLSKNWGKLETFVKWENMFYKKKDNTKEKINETDDIIHYTITYMMRDDHQSQVTFGVSYRF